MITSAQPGAAQQGAAQLAGPGSALSTSSNTLAFSGIATGFSAGEPYFDVTVGPGSISTGFASTGPSMLGGTITVDMPGISTGISIGVPNIAGPVTIDDGIPTGFSAGLPIINLPRSIEPSAGIPTGFSAGAPALRHSATIGLSAGIPTGFSAGAPIMKGGAQKAAFIQGIGTGFVGGIPNLQGGSGGLQIFLGGANVTSFNQSDEPLGQKAGMLRYGLAGSTASSAGSAMPITIQSQTLGRWTLQFDLIDWDGSLTVTMGETCLILEPNYRLFGGCVTIIQIEPVMGRSDAVIWHVTARDKSAICDRRVVKTPFYPAGMDIADVFRDIVMNYLNGEGITVSNVPATLGPLVNNFTLPGQLPTVTQAFDSLVTLYGGVWWIDSYGDLHTPTISDIPDCPYELVSPTLNARGLRMVSDSVTYANQVYAVSNLRVTPGSSTGTPGGGIGPPVPSTQGVSISETYTLPQAAAAARGFYFGALLLSFPIQAVTSIKVNGVSQPIHLGTDNINFQQSWWYWPGAPNNFIVPPNVANTGDGFALPPITSPYPNPGDVVEIQYIPAIPIPGLAPGTPLTETCGSGIWETVIQAQNIQYQDDLDTIAAADLALVGVPQKVLNFEIDLPGSAVGAKLHVDLPRLQLADTDLMITQLTGISQAGVDLGGGTVFRWTVQAVNGADQGNALKYWERVVALLEMPQPLAQQVLPTLILAPGSDLSSGTAEPNPLIVARPCAITEIAVACFVGPVDEDLYIDLIDSASGSILGAPILVPAGTASLAVVTWDNVRTPGGTWVYTNETITPVVSYVVQGANPTPAQSVSVQMRGTY